MDSIRALWWRDCITSIMASYNLSPTWRETIHINCRPLASYPASSSRGDWRWRTPVHQQHPREQWRWRGGGGYIRKERRMERDCQGAWRSRVPPPKNLGRVVTDPGIRKQFFVVTWTRQGLLPAKHSCHNTEQQVWFSILLAVRYGVREAESYEPWWILSAPSGGGTV